MFTWIPYAFVRIVVLFIAGILAGIYFPTSISPLYAIIAFAVLVVTYFLIAWLSYRPNRSINPGFVGLSAVFLAGTINVHFHDQKNWSGHLLHEKDSIEQYVAVVKAAPQRREKTWKVEVSVEKYRIQSGWKSGDGKVLLYLPASTPPSYGDRLLIEGQPQIVPPPTNPGEFDYKAFLANQSIYHQHFVKNNMVVVGHRPPNILVDHAIKARHWAERVLERFVEGTREQGIAIALVLGVTDGLDHELVSAYGATGTLHVLAVSGLHISIIYMIIAWMMTPLNRTTKGKWAVAIVSLLILWSYAFITGLSPSVLRAVTMFTFVALAKPWKQTLNIYNTLACSAFLLLLFDPHMIMAVGFQLSYLAVLGIVYLHPKLYAIFEPSSRVVDEIWKVTSVSIAAQVATLPLGLFYFHQFPNYFVFSNLLVIPASFVVLIVGILVLMVSWIPLIANGLGWLLMWVIKIMNQIVFAIESIPGSVTDHIFFTPLQAILLAIFIVAILLLIEKKKFSYFIAVFCIAIALCGDRWRYHVFEVDQRKISFYNVSHHTAIDLVDHGQAIFLADSTLENDDRKIAFHIAPARLMGGVYDTENQLATTRKVDGGRIFFWGGKYFLWLDKVPQQKIPTCDLDYVIISNNAIRTLAMISDVKASRIIVDSSNSFYLAKRLMREAEDLGFNLVAVSQQGSYHEMISL